MVDVDLHDEDLQLSEDLVLLIDESINALKLLAQVHKKWLSVLRVFSQKS